MHLEVEIKLLVDGPLGALRGRLRRLGFAPHGKRVFEANTVYDTLDHRLRGAGLLLRLRSVGRRHVLTYKGPPLPGPHKTREEIEVSLDDAGAMAVICERLGYQPLFRYEKHRTEFVKPRARGVVCVDETPIGNYVELEGRPAWIDRTAKALGYLPTAYITESYAGLYLRWCELHGRKPGHMVFEMVG